MARQAHASNTLWDLLTARPCAELASAIMVDLQARSTVHEAGLPCLYMYFPVTAVVSLVGTTSAGGSAEVAVVGREGLLGLAGVFGTVESPTSAIVLIAGTAWRVPAAAVRAARATNPVVRRTLDLYTEARLIQVAQTAVCNRLHPVEGRLARWLLDINARVAGGPFVISHELMADMLGVHRPTVSTALRRLEDLGVIARRGRTTIVTHPQALAAYACECHEAVNRAFARLFAAPALAASPDWHTGPQDASGAVAPTQPDPHVLREIAGRLLVVGMREQEARARAEDAQREKDSLMAMLSHELRAPLDAILGWCASVTHDAQLPADGLHSIEASARAQLALVEELLDTATVAAGTLPIDRATVDLGDLVTSTVEAVSPTAVARAVVLELTPVPARLLVDADASRLRTVLFDVMQNAVRFTPPGGSVVVCVSTSGTMARLVVRDTGRGIAAALVPHVFERAALAAPRAGDPGGHGLASARAVMTLHGGRISLASAGANCGTTCTIELPRLGGGDGPTRQ